SRGTRDSPPAEGTSVTNQQQATGWHNGPLASFDTETTGTNPNTARIVTAACWLITPGHDKKHREWLVNPGVEIPAEATQVHGITTEQARNQGRPAAAAVAGTAPAGLYAYRNPIPVIVYTARYDISPMRRELVRHGHAGLAAEWEQFAARGPIVD